MIRANIVSIAKSWLGTPYHHRAKVKGVGVDCAQILIAVFSEASLIEDFDSDDYPQDWMMHRSEEKYLLNIEKHAKKVDEPKPGDVALFKFGRCISHGAIIIEWPVIIHAYKPAGMVILDDVLANQSLGSRLVGFWSIVGE
jgi:cell wall-associated NlpC family hydrolase